MQVAVVGGGIVGLASAYYLADRGADVTVCEKHSFGGGSTERSVGGIRAQFSTPVNVELSTTSLEVWESFEERFGTDIQFRQAGYLFLAREEATAAQFPENVAMQNERGVDSRVLDPADAVEHCPGLRPEPFRAATYCPTDGFADPHLALEGFKQAAADAGATLRSGIEVTDLLLDDQRVAGVEIDGTERLGANAVVNAAGIWAAEVGAMAGLDLPIQPRRRQMAVVEPSTPVPEDVPLTIDLDAGSHFRPERDGAALVGGHFGDDDPTQDPDDYDRDVDLPWTAEAIERAAAVAGYFGPETRLRRGWAGCYAVTPDDNPIIEESLPGLVTAAGFSGHGFMHSPATGQVVADLVLDGEPSTVDVSPLSADRLEERVEGERNVV